jgi:hypothetical protein
MKSINFTYLIEDFRDCRNELADEKKWSPVLRFAFYYALAIGIAAGVLVGFAFGLLV